jgi:subtilisin family serine protease/subtilase family serine protease
MDRLLDRTVGRWFTRISLSLVLAVAILFSFSSSSIAEPPVEVQHVLGEVLVKFKDNFPANQRANVHAQLNAQKLSEIRGIKVHRVRGLRGQSTEALIKAYSKRPNVEYVEPNVIVHITQTPNDTSYSSLYGLHNTGQTSGTTDADIDAPEAWDTQTGSSSVIVASIDTGVDYIHEDLAANMWINSGETADNGIDDDSNGYIDDVYGWDFFNNDNDPIDDHGHGTHTSGTIAAVGNNGKGVTGVSWNSKIMAVKFLGAGGGGTMSGAASAIIYAADMGAQISNNSWGCLGSGCDSQTLNDAIAYAGTEGMLFVVSAGNDTNNNDVTGAYPCVVDSPNVLCVAATDHDDDIASFSNYGLTTVDLGAPGVEILSTMPGDTYTSWSGTSMASPYVAGAAALLLSEFSFLTTEELKNILMDSVDPITALDGITVTGGRLNVDSSLDTNFTVTGTPASQSVVIGDSTEYTLFANSLNSFNAAVTLSLDSSYTGISGSFSSNPITPPANDYAQSTLTVDTTGSTVRGEYQLLVSGTDALGEVHYDTLTLQALSPIFWGEFSPSIQHVNPGDGAAYTVTVNSVDGYTGSVTLSLTSTGSTEVSGSLSPTTITVPADGSATSTLTITTTSSVSIDDYTLTVESTDGTDTDTSTGILSVIDTDLEMTALSGPTSAYLSDSITISDTVRNQGTVAAGSFWIYYYLSTDQTITDGDIWIGKRQLSSGLAGSTNDSEDTVLTLSWTLAPGTYYIGAIADVGGVGGQVLEGDETNNSLAASSSIVITAGADLLMTAVSGPSTGIVGTDITVSNTVKNQGAGPASVVQQVHLFLSTDSTITSSDTYLGSRSQALDAGESDSDNTSVTIPVSLAIGTYYIGAISDAGEYIIETDETNNSLAGNTITLTADLDVIMTAVSGPASMILGTTSSTVSNTVKNQGTGATGDFYIGLYLSTDQTITTGDILIGSHSSVGSGNSLGGGVSSTRNTSVTIANSLTPGTYYIGAIADKNNVIVETDETNNSLVSGSTVELVIGADHVMTAVSGPSSAGVGESISISHTAKNQGTGLTGSSNVGLYLSTDAVITTGDTYLGTKWIGTMAIGQSRSNSTSVTIPTVTLGTYYIGAIADKDNGIAETDETNNGLAGNSIQIIEDVDLVMSVVDGPASASVGETVSVSNTVLNQGATGAGSFRVRIYLSTDSEITTGDTYLNWRQISSLSADASSNVSTSVTIPTSLTPGTYYIGAIADYLDTVEETDETNNSLADSSIQIIEDVDLVMSVVDGPANASVGETVSVSNTVLNQGTGGAGTFRVYYYLSTDSNITTGDTYLAYRIVGSLGADASSNVSTSVTIPTGLTAGTYYIGAIADKLNNVAETDETNNSLADSITIAISNDLVMSVVDGPASASAGDTVSVSNTVLNQGTAGGTGSFRIYYYLSTDSNITTGDTYLAYRIVSSLAASASSNVSTSVTIPSSLTAGTYYIGAIADKLNSVAETDETNNSLADSGITITN